MIVPSATRVVEGGSNNSRTFSTQQTTRAGSAAARGTLARMGTTAMEYTSVSASTCRESTPAAYRESLRGSSVTMEPDTAANWTRPSKRATKAPQRMHARS